jgi:hypothetical protein
VSFATITLCVVSQRVFTVVRTYFVIDSVRKLLDTPSYVRIFTCRGLRYGNASVTRYGENLIQIPAGR